MIERLLLASGPILAAAVAAVSLPVITRSYTEETLAAVSLILLFHALFGMLDLLKPVLIREIARNPLSATYANLLWPSAIAATFLGLAVYVGVAQMLSHILSHWDAVILALAAVLFILYAPAWATLDAHERVGTGYLVRALSTVALYLTLALAPAFVSDTLTSVPLATVNLVSLVMYYSLARPHIHRGSARMSPGFVRAVYHVVSQNASKITADFFDRLYLSLTFPVSVVGTYNIVCDVTAKTNVPAQLISAYSYPRLCRGRLHHNRFVVLGAGVSATIGTAAFGAYLTGDALVTAYFGESFANEGWLFACFLLVASVYAQSFFGQAALRASRRDAQLSRAFMLHAIVGAILTLALAPRIGIAGVLLGVMTMKSSSLTMFASLVGVVSLRVLIPALLVASANVGMFAYILSREVSL